MLIQPYILNDVFPLSPQNTVAEALDFCQKNECDAVFIVEGTQWKGNVLYEDLIQSDPEKTLSEMALEMFCLNSSVHILDAIRLYQQSETRVMPVVDAYFEYQGYLRVEDVVHALGKLPMVTEPAEWVTIRSAQKSYSLSEVTQIVESQNGKIYGAFISESSEEDVYVTLKINTGELNSILETLERFGYDVVYVSHKNSRDEMIQERYNHLMKFIDV